MTLQMLQNDKKSLNKIWSEQYIAARNEIDIDVTKFPVSLQNHYDNYYEEAFFYTWLAFLWQDIEGYRCGLKVMTVENNSGAMFSLNDFSHEFLSAYTDYDQTDTPSYIGPVFPRKLSLVELFNRAAFYPLIFNLYANYWRYFEKGDQFCEMVTYDFATGLRSGAVSENKTVNVTDIQQHENPRAALECLAGFTNQAIIDGWEEKLRPLSLPDKMHEKAFDFNFSTGSSRFEKREKPNRLKAEDIRHFESKHELKLPDSLAEYLRIFNGRQNNPAYLTFAVDDLTKVTVKQFHTLKELGDAALLTIQRRPDIIWIGILSDDALIGVCFQSNDNKTGAVETFGIMAINKDGQITICDYSIDKFSRYAQDLWILLQTCKCDKSDSVFSIIEMAKGPRRILSL